jgi:PmbA protein
MEIRELKELLKSAADRAGLTEYEIYYANETSISTETLKDEISAFSSNVGAGICFRCIVDGKMGYASTELMEADEMEALVKRAMDNARYQDYDDEVFIYEGSKEYETVNVTVPEMPTAAMLKEAALAIQKSTYAESDKITDGTQSSVFAFETVISISNSHGLELTNHVANAGCYAEAVVKVGDESQFAFEMAQGVSPEAYADISKNAVAKALKKIGASCIPSGKYNIVFSGRAMSSLLSAFWGIFSAKNVQLGLSLLKGKEGTKIASDVLTIVDDPMREGCPIQTAFDSEGVAAHRKNVVENGVLNTLLYDLATAKKAGKESTGNGLRGGYRGAVGVAPFNFYVKPSESSKEDLFRMAGDGSLYVTELKGLHAGANAVTGDFSIESAGFLIENGKIGAPIKSFTVAGNFFELLKQISAIDNVLEMKSPGFSQIGSPDVLVPDMSVAGE